MLEPYVPHYVFSRNDSGGYKRLTIEQRVLNTSPLITVQNEVLGKNPYFQPVPHDDLHLTFLHLGRPDELFAQICAVSPGLGFSTFHTGLDELLNVGVASMAQPITMLADRFDLFGSAVVLRMKLNDYWQQARERTIDTLKNILKEWGINNSFNFIANNNNLKFALVTSPHVTLGSLSRSSFLTERSIQCAPISLGAAIVRGAKYE